MRTKPDRTMYKRANSSWMQTPSTQIQISVLTVTMATSNRVQSSFITSDSSTISWLSDVLSTGSCNNLISYGLILQSAPVMWSYLVNFRCLSVHNPTWPALRGRDRHHRALLTNISKKWCYRSYKQPMQAHVAGLILLPFRSSSRNDLFFIHSYSSYREVFPV